MTAPGAVLGELTDAQFHRAQTLAMTVGGIVLDHTKRGMVMARVMRRLRSLGLPDLTAYFEKLDKDPAEPDRLMDELTTNMTSFFREADHFDLLKKRAFSINKERSLRIWSAGCSSGEEPYTMAMLINESLDQLKGVDVRVLATDLSERMLEKARAGVYTSDVLSTVPPDLRRKYFHPSDTGDGVVTDALRSFIRFAPLNLLEGWPMKGPFHVIFCRNVMIYFDKDTRQTLISRFAELLAPGGLLCVGHSESLSGLEHSLTYVQPAAYAKT